MILVVLELDPCRRPGLTPTTSTVMKRAGFTLIEVMIVILIIAVLLSIAIPQMIRARSTSQLKTCQSNQRIYDAVKSQWAMDMNIPGGTAATISDLLPYLKRVPVCPSGGTYNFGTINTTTSCSLPEHPTYSP